MKGMPTHKTTANTTFTKMANPSDDLTPIKQSGLSKAMTPKQYKIIIDGLGLSQERAGEWLGVSARTGQNYAAKGPPEPVAKLLRLMVRLKLKPEDVK
jgi:DNA-binding transcriptional regulator YiaG